MQSLLQIPQMFNDALRFLLSQKLLHGIQREEIRAGNVTDKEAPLRAPTVGRSGQGLLQTKTLLHDLQLEEEQLAN